MILSNYQSQELAEMDKAKKYAEEYTVHIAVVGAGIILAILLGIGFCFTPLCCCCCNKSQKVSYLIFHFLIFFR